MCSGSGTLEKHLTAPLSVARGDLAFESPSKRRTPKSERTLRPPHDPSFPSSSSLAGAASAAAALYEDEPACAPSVSAASQDGDGGECDERVADLVAQVLNVMPELEVERVRRYFLEGHYTTSDQLVNDALEGSLKTLAFPSASSASGSSQKQQSQAAKKTQSSSSSSANDNAQQLRKFLPKGIFEN